MRSSSIAVVVFLLATQIFAPQALEGPCPDSVCAASDATKGSSLLQAQVQFSKKLQQHVETDEGEKEEDVIADTGNASQTPTESAGLASQIAAFMNSKDASVFGKYSDTLEEMKTLKGSFDFSFGNPDCQMWSGGTCAWLGCDQSRGPTQCMNAMCWCKKGYCKGAEGRCVKSNKTQIYTGPPRTCKKLTQPLPLAGHAMGKISAAIWHLRGADFLQNGWDLKVQLQQTFLEHGTAALGLPIDHDNLGIYQKRQMCALAFAGTSNPIDYVKNLNLLRHSACGYSFHQGFYLAMMKFIKDPKWESDFKPFLKNECSEGIYVTGHSLGGAMASVFSMCANSPENPFDLQIDALYTYGAPGVSINPGLNGCADDKIFPGRRYWNYGNEGTVDPVPEASACIGYGHPKMVGVELQTDRKCKDYQPEAEGLHFLPKCTWISLAIDLPKMAKQPCPHDIDNYYYPKIEGCVGRDA